MRTKTKFKVGDIVIIGHQAMPHNEYAGFTARIDEFKESLIQKQIKDIENWNPPQWNEQCLKEMKDDIINIIKK